MTDKENPNREAECADLWRVLKEQPFDETALKEIGLIYRDVMCMIEERDYLYCFLYIFLLGKIRGIRQERARRAKRSKD